MRSWRMKQNCKEMQSSAVSPGPRDRDRDVKNVSYHAPDDFQLSLLLLHNVHFYFLLLGLIKICNLFPCSK